MGFTDAVRRGLQQYATFHGRARRSEYWWFVLFGFLVSAATTFVDRLLGFDGDVGLAGGTSTDLGPVSGLATLALVLPLLAVGARRLHDTGRSGWWQLFCLVPIVGTIAVLVLMALDGEGPNQHGASPSGNLGPAVAPGAIPPGSVPPATPPTA